MCADVAAPAVGTRESTVAPVISIVRVKLTDSELVFILEHEGAIREIEAELTVPGVFEAASTAVMQWGLLGRRLVPECTVVEADGRHSAEARHWHGSDQIVVTGRAANPLVAALSAWCQLFNFLSYYRRS